MYVNLIFSTGVTSSRRTAPQASPPMLPSGRPRRAADYRPLEADAMQQETTTVTDRQSRPDRLFFLHLPKTGGTTFYRFLENNYPQRDGIGDAAFAALRERSGDQEAFVTLLADVWLITKLHLDFSFLKRLRDSDPQIRAVTVLRSPVDRAMSSIDHWRRVPDDGVQRADPARRQLLIDARTMPLADFIERHRERLSDRQAKLIGGIADECLPVDRTQLLDAACRNLEQIDYVGVTGQLLLFAAAVSHFMGFFNSMNPHPLNVSRDPNRLSAEDRRAIRGQLAELNQVDAAVYDLAELQCERLIHRWKKALAEFSRPTVPRQLQVGETAILSMTEPLAGDGWHERERGIHAACRWAGPHRCSSLYLAVIPQGTFEVSIWMPSVISDDVLAGMAVRINSILVEQLVTTREGFQAATATVRLADTQQPFLHLELAFAQTASAWEVCGAADHRQKTVAVERVEVRRLA